MQMLEDTWRLSSQTPCWMHISFSIASLTHQSNLCFKKREFATSQDSLFNWGISFTHICLKTIQLQMRLAGLYFESKKQQNKETDDYVQRGWDEKPKTIIYRCSPLPYPKAWEHVTMFLMTSRTSSGWNHKDLRVCLCMMFQRAGAMPGQHN